MRKDMFKVIVERERRGISWARVLGSGYRKAKNFKLTEDYEVLDDFCRTKLPMKATKLGYNCKQLNENLTPLRRFLHSRVGQNWDAVYSEICENINVNSTVQQHVLSHVEDFIEINTFIGDDGKIYSKGHHGHISPVDGPGHWGRYSSLYVDPTTKLICRVDPKPRRIYDGPAKHAETFRVFLKDRVAFIKEDGTWFKLSLVPVPDPLPMTTVPGFPMVDLDVSGKIGQPWKNERKWYVQDCKKYYGAEVHAVKKQTACKKDIRNYKLRESAIDHLQRVRS